MSVKIIGAPLLIAAVAVTAFMAARPATAENALLLAMHDMMPMPTQQQGGAPMGGMPMNDPMRMPQPSQMGAPPAQGQMEQGSPSGQMGGMPMDDPMRMQQQGQMGGGMQMQPPMAPGGSTGQPGMSGQAGGMNDNMMRMMNEHMRMMNERMRMGGSMPGTAPGPSMVDLTDRLDGRLAFIRAELHITEAQDAAWKSFAEGLRSGRDHLLMARHELSQPYASSGDRLMQYERHLAERLEALRAARTSFGQLYASLDDAQKRTADELIAPLIATF